MPWGFVAAAAVSAAGTIIGSGEQAGAAENAQSISEGEFNTITGQEQPFMNAGYGALNALDQGMGIGAPNAGQQAQGVGYGSLSAPFTTQTFQTMSPAYQFQMQQGQNGVLSADSSSQGALSGAASKDLMGYNQNLANTSFNNAFNQYQTQQGNIYNRLSNIANLGQNAASNTGQQGTALAGQAAQSATNVGTAIGGGIASAGNSVANTGLLGALYQGQNNGGGGGGASPYVAGTPYGSGANSGDTYINCDCAIKKDIIHIAFDGMANLPVYGFHYLDETQDDDLHVGYMAQEAQRLWPNAVKRMSHGHLAVNYSKIPTDQDWEELERIINDA
jgi:hypothetical protein